MQKLSTLLLTAPALIPQQAADAMARRKNDVGFLIVIPIVAVIVMGFVAAWFWYCQQRGAWPAVDMPSWESGGTWKLYCRV
ncbi:hypothetical protein ACX801_07495 [Arthrobacter bambusae]